MKQVAKVFIVNVVVVVLILVLFEVFLRTFGIVPSSIVRAVYHPNLIGDYEPLISMVDNRVKAYPFRFTTNSQGVRSKFEYSETKGKNTFRILCLGDSFTMGWGVDDSETYSELLRALLQEKYKDINIEVIPAGGVFSNILDQADYYFDKGRKLHPDLVVLQFYPNDIYNEMSRGRVDRIKNKSNAIPYSDGLADKFKRFIFRTATFNYIGKLIVDVVGVKRLVGMESPVSKSGHEAFLESFLVHGGFNVDLASDWNELLNENTIDANKMLWGSYLSAMKFFQETLKRDGVGLQFVIVPNDLQVEKYLNAPSCVFSQYAKENGLHWTDFSSVFREYVLNEAENTKFILKGDGHTNALGNTLMATILANKIHVYKQDGRILFNVDSTYENKRNYKSKEQLELFCGNSALLSRANTPGIVVTDVKQDKLTVPNRDESFVECDTPDGSPCYLKVDFHTDKMVSALDIVFKYSVFNDQLKNNKLSMSLATNGGDYHYVNIFSSDGNGGWSSRDRLKILESNLSSPANDFSLLIQFVGKAGIMLPGSSSAHSSFSIYAYQ